MPSSYAQTTLLMSQGTLDARLSSYWQDVLASCSNSRTTTFFRKASRTSLFLIDDQIIFCKPHRRTSALLLYSSVVLGPGDAGKVSEVGFACDSSKRIHQSLGHILFVRGLDSNYPAHEAQGTQDTLPYRIFHGLLCPFRSTIPEAEIYDDRPVVPARNVANNCNVSQQSISDAKASDE